MDIIYHGGVLEIESLEPKMTYDRHINPTHPSDLTLEWIDSLGVKHSHLLGYIEHNNAGSVEITVEHDNSISVADKIRDLPWPL